MTELSQAYQLAEHLHETLYGTNSVLTSEELRASGVSAMPSHPIGAPSITAFATDRSFRQSMSRGINGHYYFSEVQCGYGGAVRLAQVTPNSAPEKVDLLADSLFMKALIRVALDRYDMPRQRINDENVHGLA